MQRKFAVTFIRSSLNYLFELRSKDAKFQPGKISAIGGHVESGETPLSALMRELKEETTLQGDVIDRISFNFLGVLTSIDKGYKNIAHFYIADVDTIFDSTVKGASIVSVPKNQILDRIDEFTYFTGRAFNEFEGIP